MYENEPEFETEPKPAENISADGLEKISENPLDFDIPETVCCDYRQPYKRARRLLYNDKDYERAYKALVTEVKHGNVPAMFDLGKMYQNNLYVDKDSKKAEYLFKHALRGYILLENAEPSDFFEYQIGRIYALETEFQDYDKERGWFETAADKENKYAMFALGKIYYYGNGTDIDYEKAFDYMSKSAERRCVHSYFRLGYMLRKGIGCEENIEESDKWFSKMIAHYESCIIKLDALNYYILGQLYEKGWGCEKDIDKAMQYYAEACEANNANAEFALGRLYITQGDEEQGEEYINRAIEHGNEYAEEWYENWKEYRQNIYTQAAVHSAANLFCRLASLINISIVTPNAFAIL